MQDTVKCRLLSLARRTIEAETQNLPYPPIQNGDWPPLDHSGAFVTLRTRGRLRGCIGTFKPLDSLALTVREMSASACRDPRFLTCPVMPQELPDLRIEISVLSPLERTLDPWSLELGKHGVYMRRGEQAGCFLPQVATEMGWDKDTFLSQCCAGKAGLPSYAWQDRDTEVYLFTTECFSEAELLPRPKHATWPPTA